MEVELDKSGRVLKDSRVLMAIDRWVLARAALLAAELEAEIFAGLFIADGVYDGWLNRGVFINWARRVVDVPAMLVETHLVFLGRLEIVGW